MRPKTNIPWDARWRSDTTILSKLESIKDQPLEIGRDSMRTHSLSIIDDRGLYLEGHPTLRKLKHASGSCYNSSKICLP